MTNNNYEQKCLELDKSLAEAFGWVDTIESYSGYSGKQTGWSGILGKSELKSIPRWTQDDGECFKLMVDHKCFPQLEDSWHSVMCCGGYYYLGEYDTEQSAVRFAICSAVLAKLTNK